MAEGYDPSQYHRQAQEAEAYNLNMEGLEKQESLQHRIEPKAISKIRSTLLAILACVIVAGLLLGTAAICMYPLSN